MSAEGTFVPTRGDDDVWDRRALQNDLRDAYAGIGLTVRIYDPAGEEFWTGQWPSGDPGERVPSFGVYFQTFGDILAGQAASRHSTVYEFDCSWPSVGPEGLPAVIAGLARRRWIYGRAVPLTAVPELTRCLRVEAAEVEPPSLRQRFLGWVAR